MIRTASAHRRAAAPVAVVVLVAAAAATAAAGCAHPLPLTDAQSSATLAARQADYHPRVPDPDGARDADLLRPRFGLPRFARAGAPIELEWLERGGPSTVRAALAPRALGRRGEAAALRCLDAAPPPGCVALSIDGVIRTPIEPGTVGDAASAAGKAAVRVRAGASPVGAAPPAGPYDLVFAGEHDAPFRAIASVWLRDDDPAAPRPLSIALLSDPHVGKHVAHLEENFLAVIDEINHRPLDLVIVTGDITNMGSDATLAPRARAFLERIEAPLLVVIGNHDHGFGSPMFEARLGSGYFNFARTFHALPFYQLTFGGWELVGFDSGPSRPSPSVNNRGLAPESLARLGAVLDEAKREQRRGVILFSHCATRASLSGRTTDTGLGVFGRMAEGAEELERLELDAAEGGLRVLHLGGHTHWSDLFEAHRDERGRLRFQLDPRAPQQGWRPLDTPAAIVTVQAATHPGLFIKQSAHGFGYALLRLDATAMESAFIRHDQAIRLAPAERSEPPFVETGAR